MRGKKRVAAPFYLSVSERVCTHVLIRGIGRVIRVIKIRRRRERKTLWSLSLYRKANDETTWDAIAFVCLAKSVHRLEKRQV